MKKIIGSLVVLFVGGISAQSTILTSDSFDYTGNLTDNGWTAFAESGTTPVASAGDFATLAQGGGGEDVQLSFAATTASDTTYVGFDLTIPSATAVAQTEILNLSSTISAALGPARTYLLPATSGGDYTIGTSSTGAGIASWATDLTFGTTYHIQVAFRGAVDDTSRLWVNATDESDPSVTGTGTLGFGVDGVNLYQQATSLTGDVQINNLVVADTFAETAGGVVIPEPGTFALFALGGLAVARRKRSK